MAVRKDRRAGDEPQAPVVASNPKNNRETPGAKGGGSAIHTVPQSVNGVEEESRPNTYVSCENQVAEPYPGEHNTEHANAWPILWHARILYVAPGRILTGHGETTQPASGIPAYLRYLA